MQKTFPTSQRKKWQKKLQQSAARRDAGDRKTSRIVLDANVWYSAFVHGRAPERVLDFCLDHRQIVVSETLINELATKLKRKAGAPQKWVRFIRLSVDRICDVIVTGIPVQTVTRDPNDEHIVVAALEGGCSMIVTGDKDLLEVGQYRGILIVTPAEFLELVTNN